MAEAQRSDKFRRILRAGWKGLCPRCGEASMFRSWLKIADRCPACGLDYRFASPDDGPAFFSLCFVAFPLIFVAVWLQVAFDPPAWVHVVTSLPLLVIGCLVVLRPFKGWLVASQYVNRAEQAGTAELWARLHGREPGSGSSFED